MCASTHTCKAHTYGLPYVCAHLPYVCALYVCVLAQVQCVRCGKMFVDDETNTPTACRFHRGHKIVLPSFGVGYSCCRRCVEVVVLAARV